jgi:hypothetical protein
MAERRVIDQAFALWCPARGLDHVGLEPGFVQKNEPFQLVRHGGLAVSLPDVPLLRHVRAFAFIGDQRLLRNGPPLPPVPGYGAIVSEKKERTDDYRDPLN